MTELCYSRPMTDRIFSRDALVDSVILRIGVDRNAATTVANGAAWLEARLKCISIAASNSAVRGLRALNPALLRISHGTLASSRSSVSAEGQAINPPPPLCGSDSIQCKGKRHD